MQHFFTPKLGRSVSISMSASIAWFPVDNLGMLFLFLAARLTHNDFWSNITAYLLGPNLNVMPTVVLPLQLKANSIGIPPLTAVNGAHTLWVALVYAAIFATIAIILTWKRDVKE